MRLTDEMIKQDNKKFAHHNAVTELKYMGVNTPHRKSITNDDIRFYAWLCRMSMELLDSKVPKKVYEVENDFTGLPVTHCPKCNIALPMYLYGRGYDGELQFCPYCGQAVTW